MDKLLQELLIQNNKSVNEKPLKLYGRLKKKIKRFDNRFLFQGIKPSTSNITLIFIFQLL